MPQLRACTSQLKIPHTGTKTQVSQIDKYFLKVNECISSFLLSQHKFLFSFSYCLLLIFLTLWQGWVANGNAQITITIIHTSIMLYLTHGGCKIRMPHALWSLHSREAIPMLKRDNISKACLKAFGYWMDIKILRDLPVTFQIMFYREFLYKKIQLTQGFFPDQSNNCHDPV